MGGNKKISGKVLNRYIVLKALLDETIPEFEGLTDSIKEQVDAGRTPPGTYYVGIKEQERRNPKWKTLFGNHLKSEGLDEDQVEVFYQGILKQTKPTVCRELVVRRVDKDIARKVESAKKTVADVLKSVHGSSGKKVKQGTLFD